VCTGRSLFNMWSSSASYSSWMSSYGLISKGHFTPLPGVIESGSKQQITGS
jgi:hypothetical protein